MTSKTVVYKLLFQALLDMRQRGHESGDKVVFHLADLFHNAVLQLEEVAEDGNDDRFEEILAFVQRRASEKGCSDWVNDRINELSAKAAN